MTATSYRPNFNDPRVKKRLIKVLKFCEEYIGAGLDQAIHSLRIRSNFGNNQLGHYLQQTLLVKVNPYYEPGLQSQRYRLNLDNLNFYRQKLDMPPTTLRHRRLEQRFQQQADSINTGVFVYTDTGHRSYNGLQMVPKLEKPKFWAEYGYTYDYDIECCAPTLFLQTAQKINPKMRDLPKIQQYLTDKSKIRDDLCIKYNISSRAAKQILNALFQGSVLNCYSKSQIIKYINGNTWKMRSLCQDQYLIGLAAEIKYLWGILRSRIDTGYEYKGDQKRKRRITGKHKADYYKHLEGLVMKPIWKHLTRTSVRYFKEHDGFRSDRFIDPDELAQLVFCQTGYRIKFIWNKV